MRRRRESWVDEESKIAADARNGFQKGVVTGMIGMAVAGLTRGRVTPASRPAPSRLPSLEEAYGSRISPADLKQMQEECAAKGTVAARPHHGPLRLAADSDGWQAAHLTPGCSAHGRRRAGTAGLCESRESFVVRNSAVPVKPSCAWRCAQARQSPAAKTKCPPLIARSVCTVAPACGIAKPMVTMRKGTSNSMLVRADCTLR